MFHRFARLVAPGLVVAALAFQSSAQAGMVTVTGLSTGGMALGNAASYSTFDTLATGSANQTSGGLSLAFSTGGAVVNGSAISQYVAPIFSGNNNAFFYNGAAPAPGTDTTNYLSTGTGSITFRNSSGGTLGTYFGLLIGSLDGFNALTFNFADGSASAVLTGSALGQLGALTNGTTTYYVNISASTALSSVVATSGINSFEIDNVAYGTAAVPEPASMALVGLGLAGVALVARKRRV